MRLSVIRPSIGSAAVFMLLLAAPATFAQGAVRDLPSSVLPNETFTVTITLDPPGGTGVVGVEDQPPSGWVVSNISDSGTFDTGTESVKWGPFFEGSIPASVTYDATAPPSFPGDPCFDGTVSFDAQNEPVTGDVCLPSLIPAVSAWGMLILSLLIVAAGQLRLMRRAHDPSSCGTGSTRVCT